jgi:hypothetical protein
MPATVHINTHQPHSLVLRTRNDPSRQHDFGFKWLSRWCFLEHESTRMPRSKELFPLWNTSSMPYIKHTIHGHRSKTKAPVIHGLSIENPTIKSTKGMPGSIYPSPGFRSTATSDALLSNALHSIGQGSFSDGILVLRPPFSCLFPANRKTLISFEILNFYIKKTK